MRGRLVLRTLGVIGAASLVLGLAACGNVNAATGAGDALEEMASEWDETVTVATSGSNTLPWTGTAEATVVLDDETSMDRVREIGAELGTFLSEAYGGSVSWTSLDLQVDGVRVGVDRDSDVNGQRLDTVEDLRFHAGVVAGFVEAADDWLVGATGDGETVGAPDSMVELSHASGSVCVVTGPGVPMATAFGIAREAADGVAGLSQIAVVAAAEDGSFVVTDASIEPDESGETNEWGEPRRAVRSATPVAAMTLAGAVTAAAPTSEITATADALSVVLSDPAAADAVVARFGYAALRVGVTLTVE